MVLRGLLVAWIGVAIVLQSGAARADAAEIEALIAKGNELRRAGTPGPALPYFRHAYELQRTPRTTAQLGLCELAAGYPVEAEEHLAAALQSPNDPSIVKYRQMLADSLKTARSQIGELAIQGSPAGAEVVIDGRVVGALPLHAPVKVVARNTEVVVRARGHAEHTEMVPIASGQRHDLTVNLESTEKPIETKGQVLIKPLKPTAVDPPPKPPGTDDPRRGASGARTAAWVTAGAAVAAAGTGLVLNLASNSKSSSFDADCFNSSMGPAPLPGKTGVSQSDCKDRYDAWHSYQNWSYVGYVAGAALAVTSGVLFWMSRPASPADAAAHAHLTCAPSPTGLACLGRF